MNKKHPTRRAVLKKAVYTAPALLTLTALPSFAAAGSGQPEDPPSGGIKILPSPERPPRKKPKKKGGSSLF